MTSTALNIVLNGQTFVFILKNGNQGPARTANLFHIANGQLNGSLSGVDVLATDGIVNYAAGLSAAAAANAAQLINVQVNAITWG